MFNCIRCSDLAFAMRTCACAIVSHPFHDALLASIFLLVHLNHSLAVSSSAAGITAFVSLRVQETRCYNDVWRLNTTRMTWVQDVWRAKLQLCTCSQCAHAHSWPRAHQRVCLWRLRCSVCRLKIRRPLNQAHMHAA